MSEAAIAALTRRNEELTAQITTLNAEAKTRRIENRKLKARVEEADGKAAALTAERDELKTKATAAPNELQATIAELQGKLDSRDHSDAFHEALQGFKVRAADGKEADYGLNQGATLQDVWQALSYKPEGARPEGTQAVELLGQALQAKPYLFAARQTAETATPAPGGAPTAIRTPATPPGPGASRSDASRSESQTTPSARSRIDAQFAALGKDKPGRIA